MNFTQSATTHLVVENGHSALLLIYAIAETLVGVKGEMAGSGTRIYIGERWLVGNERAFGRSEFINDDPVEAEIGNECKTVGRIEID